MVRVVVGALIRRHAGRAAKLCRDRCHYSVMERLSVSGCRVDRARLRCFFNPHISLPRDSVWSRGFFRVCVFPLFQKEMRMIVVMVAAGSVLAV